MPDAHAEGQSDTELLRSRLSAIVDSSDDVIISETLDGVVTSWNRSAELLFGWTAGEAIGQHISLIIPLDRRAEEDKVLARVRLGERVDHFETVRVSRDGRLTPVSVTVSPIKDARGRIVGISKIARNLANREAAGLALSRLAAIVDSSDDVIVSKTLDGVIMTWNRAAERLFGWTAAEAVGQHITLIIPRERLAEEDEVLARIRRGESVDHFETIRVAKDGQLRTVSITVSPVRDAFGRIVGASKIARDVSERQRMEDARARLLAREQEARAEAEALNRAKDELLATVSHELRTPLNSIFGWAHMIRGVHVDDALRLRAVAAILRSAAAQARLVEDLLDFSRIITGHMRLDFEPVDLNAVIEAALEAVRPAATLREIALVTALDHSLGTIMGAPDRLQQVVWNLVMNAVKFTPRGGRVDVSLRRTTRTVDIEVKDTGEGIDQTLLPYVFEAFRQGDSSTTRGHGGLGLGLALVRQLVELHGGRVRAESGGRDQGSTFTATLPAATPRQGAPRVGEPSQEEGDLDLPPALRGVRVLVVDDDSESLEVSAMTLRVAGAEVRTASAAFSAYELIQRWQPDAVLTDLAMPGEDGYMLLRAMRTFFAERRATVPIIAFTAYGTSENRTRAVQAGFDLYLTKPIDPHKLTRAVAEAVHRVS
jgi:PAS domain S-box-containing protein